MTTPPNVSMSVAVADPLDPTHVVKPNADGSINVTTTPGVAGALGYQFTTITSSTSKTTIVTANATKKNRLYGLIIANKSATGVDVLIEDDSADVVRIYVPATDTRGFMLPADSGVNQAAVNKNWSATSSSSVDSLYITALFTAE